MSDSSSASTNGYIFSDISPGVYDWGEIISATYETNKTTYNWKPNDNITVDMLLVGGGGGGGGVIAGGGGGGGYLFNDNINLLNDSIVITVGNGGIGGTGHPTSGIGTNGENTTVGDYIAYGGGCGGSYSSRNGRNGGSGGGGSIATSGGSSIDNQGYQGGIGYYIDGNSAGGGGGGAGGPGQQVNGGIGRNDHSNIFGNEYGVNGWFSSGGGGGTEHNTAGIASNGGGNGSKGTNFAGNGTHFSGGGGGGAGWTGNSSARLGGSGGSGIVLIKIK